MYPIYLLFRCTFNKKNVSKCGKILDVTPVLKFGDQLNVKNYWSTSIYTYCILAKLFESRGYHLIKRSSNHIIINEQHSFRPVNQLLPPLCYVFTTFITDSFERGNQVYVIFTNFRKAFNTVDYGVLLRELSLLGIGIFSYHGLHPTSLIGYN